MDKISKCQKYWMLYRINCQNILSDFIKKTDEGEWTKELNCDGFIISYKDYMCSCHQLFNCKNLIDKDKFILLSSYSEIEDKKYKFNFVEKSSLNKLRKKMEKR